MADEPEAIAGLSQVAGDYEVLLCDVFGVLHDAARIFPAAIAALSAFRAAGGTVVLVSNAADPGRYLADALRARGIAAVYDALVTSADIARMLLSERAPAGVHHIGPARDRILFAGLPVTLTGVEDAACTVCTGYPDGDDDLDAILCRALRRGLHLLCTNPDTSLMVGATRLRFAGLVAARYRTLGGAVVETGKPGALIYRHALERAERAQGRPVAPGRVLGIGDTPALDVAGALSAGFSALQIGDAPSRPRPAGAAGRLYGLPALLW
ncbi:TIGR01459 family HAD-type hydrolase [Methylobacterium sp. J-030]|uniref:TIGR01459 family HAD-type hydrolase n=1 Tax=Methylobacterium sp. J-030 TaxID=2836627 RepID=UPI001FBBC266|nr:TIGR01459 family HAD-type hydrolase [Methylobacterium sp. J-030]MCJ2071746.1 TIGR01459 family HAD-type hydrolase [Methylobacterium sp. J-030]